MQQQHPRVRPERRVEPRERVQQKVGELTAVLDAGGAAADDDEREHARALSVGEVGLRRALDRVADAAAQLLRVRELLKEAAVLEHAGDRFTPAARH